MDRDRQIKLAAEIRKLLDVQPSGDACTVASSAVLVVSDLCDVSLPDWQQTFAAIAASLPDGHALGELVATLAVRVGPEQSRNGPPPTPTPDDLQVPVLVGRRLYANAGGSWLLAHPWTYAGGNGVLRTRLPQPLVDWLVAEGRPVVTDPDAPDDTLELALQLWDDGLAFPDALAAAETLTPPGGEPAQTAGPTGPRWRAGRA